MRRAPAGSGAAPTWPAVGSSGCWPPRTSWRGSGPFLTAAAAWDGLAAELHVTAASYHSVISGLASSWTGPASASMVGAVAPYVARMQAYPHIRHQDLVLAHRPAPLFHQVAQQLELGAGEVQHGAGPAHHTAVGVQHQIADLQGRRHPSAPARHGAHPGDQLGYVERLDHVVVRTGIEAAQPVRERVPGGEQDDGSRMLHTVRGIGYRLSAAQP